MKKISGRIRQALFWEVFTDHATPQQRGFWIDKEPGQWINIGIGLRVLCIARLPDGYTHGWARRMRRGFMHGLVYDLAVRLPFTPWTLALHPGLESAGRPVLHVERTEDRTPWVSLAH